MNLKKILNQTAVYWTPLLDDGWGGKSYNSPIEVAVRWTDSQEKFVDNNAEEHISRSYILAETDFEIEGRMFLGSLTDLSSDQDPETNSALTIKSFNKIPDKLARKFLRKVYLV